MKLLIVLIGFIGIALGQKNNQAFLEEVHAVGAKCITETQSTDADFALLVKHEIPENHAGKCLIFCIFKHYQVQTEDGNLNPEGALQSLNKLKESDPVLYDNMIKIAFACGTNAVIDPDPCITAALVSRCAIEEGKKMGIAPDIFEL